MHKTDDAVDSHTIEIFASEDSRYPIEDKVEIPQRYDINELVILPVNKNTLFVYWEITDDFFQNWQRQKGLSSAVLVLSVFELSPEKATHIAAFSVSELSGRRYITYQTNFKPTFAAIGVFKDKVYYNMLLSRTIYYPSYRLEAISTKLISEFWLNQTEEQLRLIQVSTGQMLNQKSEDCIVQERLEIEAPRNVVQAAESWEYTYSQSNLERKPLHD
ncbi:MAG: DUF4912 domain-containing protein [Nitrospirae bacterium]|nr:DUF4912 domain-containing protein [Nitrospirota bacterium]